jgi:hypothetical protein
VKGQGINLVTSYMLQVVNMEHRTWNMKPDRVREGKKDEQDI